ncbi:hypothetical protein [Nocardiopsis potens]|uniref:hypothetical protein n=1 Tax=Nocardiopsis potens TaxID=1246458 RepID=UPI00034AC15F|nr:hypothetical protein [Nocardiopsis potens]
MSGREAYRNIGTVLADRPGALAEFGRILGAAGVGLEGGGVFTHGGRAVANFLVDDADLARAELERHGIGPVSVDDVVALRLDQEAPGQLGAFAHRLGEAGIDVLVQYSDHDHRLILVVRPEQYDECRRIAARWDTEREARRP